jgi:HSP20 family molecular chaperone IbpA
MTKLRELWNRTKEAVNRGRLRRGKVRVSAEAGGEGEHLTDRPLFAPAVDILENASELLIVADVPGAQPVDTMVSVSGDSKLVLYARVPEPEHHRQLAVEYDPADWYWSFRIPDSFDGERARASLQHGVLTIRIPRRKDLAPRLIPVRARV